MDFMIQVSVYYKPLICFCVNVRVFISFPIFGLIPKMKWCRETTGRASNINIRIANHSHLSVREEPQHTNTCGTSPAGQTALGRSPVREEPQHTNTCGTSPAGQTTLGRLPVREEPQHTNTCRPTLPTRPYSAGHRSGRSCNTYACGQSC